MHGSPGLSARIDPARRHRRVWPFLSLLLLLPTLALADFLPAEQAFRVAAAVESPERLRLEWTVAEGYYLYRAKFRFQTESRGVSLGAPEVPPGEIREDEFFGQVEILRGRFAIRLPLQRTADSGDSLVLQVGFQGCAEAGFCYPPRVESLRIALPPPPAAAAPQSVRLADRIAAGARTILGFDPSGDLLPVEEAFRFQAEAVAPDRLALSWDIAPGTFLYANLLELTLEESPGVAIAPYERPAGELLRDAVLPDGSQGDVEVYHDRLDLLLPLRRADAAPTDIQLVARYQGCAEIGVCYPPQTQRRTLRLPAAAVATALPAPDSEPGAALAEPTAGGGVLTPDRAASAPAPAPVQEQDRIAGLLASGNLWMAVLAFFGFGLLLAFTPCVLPMIPILSGIIAGQGKDLTTGRALTLSTVYVLAMALTYTLVGVLAGLTGANLQPFFQHPAILVAFALVFVLLALAMFGFYELQVPAALQTRLASLSNRQAGGTLTGVAIMGLLSALIVGPCVAPPLFGALIYIGQTGDALLGGLALFALSLGMGAPLIAIGASAGRLLPRAGPWMDAVKAVFGVALLGVAILMLERILPPAIALSLWGLLLICSAVYMGALTTLPAEAGGWRKLWKGLGLALMIHGALMLVGAAAGGRDPLQPLRGLAPGGTPAVARAEFRPVKTLADLERELAAARAAGRPALLDFYADWCVTCKQMERETFADPAASAAMGRFVLLKADITANDADDRALYQERFGLPGPPAILFFDPDGGERTPDRLIGFVPAANFVAHLLRIAP